MKEQSFTPGPWKIGNRAVAKIIISHGEGYASQTICEIKNPAGFKSMTTENKADANLIAAAPDMYELLQVIRGYLSYTNEADIKMRKRIDVVINKANPQTVNK